MDYLYAENRSYEDLAAGRVLPQRGGGTNFPARLAIELFHRGRVAAGMERGVRVLDPCCGGGYLLTVLGLCCGESLASLTGCDVDGEAVAHTRSLLRLLTPEGLSDRETQLQNLYALYGKETHQQALASLARLRDALPASLATDCFLADATQEGALQGGLTAPVDLVLGDLPYGSLAAWNSPFDDPPSLLLRNALQTVRKGGAVVLCMDKAQKLQTPEGAARVQRQTVGKRRFDIFVKE